MTGKDKYSVLLPTYNERQNLPYIIFLLDEAFTACHADYEIVIVDDNSPDGTLTVAKRLQSLYGESYIKLAPREGKLGLGSAYVHGFDHASGNFILILDADLSHHPRYIPSFIAMQRSANYDIVSGTRYVSNGGVFGWSFSRKVVSRAANFLAQVFLQPGVTDLTGSFRLFKRDVFGRIMKDVVSTGYVFQMEVIVRAKLLRFAVAEVPIVFVDRMFGESKLGSTEVAHYLRGMWVLVTSKFHSYGVDRRVYH